MLINNKIILKQLLKLEKLEDKRRHQRSLCYLKAIDGETGKHIGHVGDIHHEGLNLISEVEMPLQNDLSISVETLGEEIKISLVIKGVWNQMNDEPTHYKTGCQIIDPSPETIDGIHKLIKALKKGGRNPFKYNSPISGKTGLA
jgi:hypothetical protein